MGLQEIGLANNQLTGSMGSGPFGWADMDMDGLSKEAKKAFAQESFGALRHARHDSLKEFDDVDYENLLRLD